MLSKLFYTLKNCDWWIFFAIVILTILGIVIIYSVGINSENSDLSRFYKQIIFFSLGLMLMFVLSVMDYRHLSSYANIFYFLGIALLIGVLLFGKTIRGTTGWFIIGPVSFQPVEIAKIFLIIFLAYFFSRNGFEIYKINKLLLSIVFSSIYVFLVVLQPDLGSALIFVFLWFGYVLLSNIKKSQVLIIFITICIFATISWFFILKDYQQERILTFINPSRDRLNSGYNVVQSIIAIGSGQWWGRGLGLGSQSQLHFLPEQEADFIFAVIGEEMGFLGTLMVIILFSFIFFRIWLLLKKINDDFTLYLVLGISIILFTQIIINIGMNIGLMPVTGLPLPFVSAGGSSLIINLSLIGILQSIYQRSHLT